MSATGNKKATNNMRFRLRGKQGTKTSPVTRYLITHLAGIAVAKRVARWTKHSASNSRTGKIKVILLRLLPVTLNRYARTRSVNLHIFCAYMPPVVTYPPIHQQAATNQQYCRPQKNVQMSKPAAYRLARLDTQHHLS